MSKKPNHQRDRWCRRAAVFALPEYSAGRRTLRYTLRLLGQGGAGRGEGRLQEKKGRGVEGFYPELFLLKIERIHLPLYLLGGLDST